jgi:hypothetical protein
MRAIREGGTKGLLLPVTRRTGAAFRLGDHGKTVVRIATMLPAPAVELHRLPAWRGDQPRLESGGDNNEDVPAHDPGR